MRKIGYIRVSTKEQNIDRQLDALENEGCQVIYQEHKSGKSRQRPELSKMLKELTKGDIVITLSVFRLARSLSDLLEISEIIKRKGAGLKILNTPVDTSTTHGRLVFNIMGVIAEFEREFIIERTRQGLAAAKARGRVGGRPPGITESNKPKFYLVEKMLNQNPPPSIREIAQVAQVSPTTVMRWKGKIKEQAP